MSVFADYSFASQKALVRVDFNVPLNEHFAITDDTRMTAAIPTIEKILNDGGSVILMSHFGRPKDGPTDKYSLKHLLPHLQELLKGRTVHFANDCIGDEAFQKEMNRKLPDSLKCIERKILHTAHNIDKYGLFVLYNKRKLIKLSIDSSNL